MLKQERERPAVGDISLYQVSRALSRNDRKDLGLTIPVRVFVQDPLVAEKHRKDGVLGIEEIDLDWEPGVTDGPTSARIAVVDYNADTGATAKPVVWDPEAKKFVHWDLESERYLDVDDPNSFQFHQVNVWAIVQHTLAFFEDPYVMGRPIPWGFDGNKLIVVPHAGTMRNAFYDRRSKSLQFYYFPCDGQRVYTCLSHDIVAHETGHAILDGIRPYYYQVSSVQTAAFHEFLADLTAILSALRIRAVRHAVADISKGNLWEDDVISDLAEEFARDEVRETYGDAERYYLRTAKNEMTMQDIENKLEPHDCSQVLTGAMFEILAQLTKLHKDDYGRSTRRSLWRATDHVNRMAFRALDFCPPVDVQFIDYARAVLRANELAYPRDSLGYQKIAQDMFEKRGLSKLSPLHPPYSVELIWKYDMDSVASSRTAAYHFLNDNRDRLDIPLNQDIEVVDLYYTDKVIGGNIRLPREIVLEYVWAEDVTLDGERFGRFQGEIVPLLCGGTLVFDGRGNILYWSKKGGTQTGEDEQEGRERKQKLLDYVERLIRAGMIGLTDGDGADTLDVYQPAIMGRQAGGAFRLEMTPHLLHSSTK